MMTGHYDKIAAGILPLPHSGYPPNDRFAHALTRLAAGDVRPDSLYEMLPPCAVAALEHLSDPKPFHHRRRQQPTASFQVLAAKATGGLRANLKPVISAMSDVFEYLGPQSVSDVELILSWSQTVYCRCKELLSLMESAKLIVPSDVCLVSTPPYLCCAGHRALSAVGSKSEELKKAVQSMPYRADYPHNVPTFPSDAKYPSLSSENTPDGIEKMLHKCFVQRPMEPVDSMDRAHLNAYAEMTDACTKALSYRVRRIERSLTDEILQDRRNEQP